MALARTSGQVLANPDNMAIGAAEDTTAVCLPADPPAHGRQKERMVNYIFVRTLAWPLPTMTVHVGIAVLGTDMPKLMKQDLLVSRVS